MILHGGLKECGVNCVMHSLVLCRTNPQRVPSVCWERHALQTEVSTLVFSVHTWYFWSSLVPNREGKKEEGKKKSSMFMWKAQRSDSPAIWSQWERRIWRRVFLNPRETSKAVLRGGQARQDGGAPYKNLPGRWAFQSQSATDVTVRSTYFSTIFFLTHHYIWTNGPKSRWVYFSWCIVADLVKVVCWTNRVWFELKRWYACNKDYLSEEMYCDRCCRVRHV